MKIYSKKGFVLGLIWSVVGGWLFILSVTSADISAHQIKNTLISLVLVLIGLTSLIRAFSKKATKQDFIEEQDERNRFVNLKAKSKVLDLMVYVLTGLIVVGLTGYIITKNIAWGFVFLIPALLISFYLISSIIVYLYYDKHE